MKLSKAEVQKRIQSETVNGETVYYSYAEKYQATLSMFKNERLLVFNFNTGLLFYINEPKQLPFKTNLPKPKNDCADMNISIAKNPPGTNQLHLDFLMFNQKKQSVKTEWTFLLQNKTLAKDWLRVIQQFKNKKVEEMMEVQKKKRQESNPQPTQQQKPPEEKVNNAWIHDTLGFGLMYNSKKQDNQKNDAEMNSSIKKQEEPKRDPLIQNETKPLQQSTVKPQPNQNLPGKMAQSKFEVSPQKKPQQSQIKPPQPTINIRESNTKIVEPINNNQAPSTKNIQSSTNNMQQSNNKNLQHSLIRKSIDPKNIQGSQSNIQGSQSNIQGSRANIQGTQPNIQGTQPNIQGSQANIQQSAPNIKGSSSNNREPIVNPTPPSIKQSQTRPIGESTIKGSKPNPNNNSQIKRAQNQEPDLRFSKMTLRDQLESIIQRSHLRQSKFQNSFITQQEQSRITNNDYNPENDWNLKFLRKQNQEVLLDFQQYAKSVFLSILNEDKSSLQPIRIYFKPDSFICVADSMTLEAKKLKAEFRNYHFIMEATKDNFIVGVPLSCLIQFQGVVALVQTLIPQQAPKLQLTNQILHELKDLQRYTRIKNNILKKAAIYDLTDLYDSKEKTLIYINQLIEYLPVHIQESYKGGLLRSQHILDNVNQFIQGGMAQEANRQDLKTIQQVLGIVNNNVKQLAKQLSNQEIIFANGSELKNIMHQRGINLKYLPVLYTDVSNKQVKKYVHTFMISKLAKDYIIEKLTAQKRKSSSAPSKEIVQNIMKHLYEGNNTLSNELWKEIAIRFRKEFNIPMSHHDISGPFFLSSLMKIIPGVYDLSKLNDKKIPFKDEAILNKGFVAQLIPKVKSYKRYTTELTDKIIYTCQQQKTEENYSAIITELKLQSKSIPRTLELSGAHGNLKQYLSYFTCPSQFNSKSFPNLKLFESVNEEPPTTISISTTRNYLQWCLQKDQVQKFKEVIQMTLPIINYWFDSSHLYHCDFLELMADYFQLTGNVDESIKLLKESLGLCIKNGAGTTKKAGEKYFNLAERELRTGRKKDSMQNFIKAKNIMQNNNDQTSKYPITLVKLSSLYLNGNDFENCIIFAKKAIEKFEDLQKLKLVQKGFYDPYCIKAIQIMTRAFQIQNKKAQLYKVAQLSCARYAKTKSPQVYDQLIKICLTAVIFKQNQQKCDAFKSIIQKLSGQNNNEVSSQKCLQELMRLAEQSNIMEKFMFKFQSLERILVDLNNRRTLANETKEFLNIVTNMVGIVGEDYIFGLIKQKEFE